MEPATLGGLLGAGEVRSRVRSEGQREYRGTFAFHRRHELAILDFFNRGEPVEFEGPIDGERRGLRAILTDVSLAMGLVSFQGLGEPY